MLVSLNSNRDFHLYAVNFSILSLDRSLCFLLFAGQRPIKVRHVQNDLHRRNPVLTKVDYSSNLKIRIHLLVYECKITTVKLFLLGNIIVRGLS